MGIEEKDKICHPQHIVMNTLRVKIMEFGEELKDLADRLDGMEKSISSRIGELSSRIDNNDRELKSVKDQIETVKSRIENLEGKFTEMNDFLKETKIKWSIWKKCLIFMKEFPGHVVAFIGAITAIIMYLTKFLGF